MSSFVKIFGKEANLIGLGNWTWKLDFVNDNIILGVCGITVD